MDRRKELYPQRHHLGSSAPGHTLSNQRFQGAKHKTETMTQAQIEAAVDAISILNNITDSTTTEILNALYGRVLSKDQVVAIQESLDGAEED